MSPKPTKKDAGLTVVQSNSFDPAPGPSTGTDKDGVLRPQGTAFDLGAYEFVSGTTVSRPNPPTNLTAVVH
ncbi:MAG TPA: choice-of-anchor Q domain-containing protein [Candidatus Angelobacter sp.]